MNRWVETRLTASARKSLDAAIDEVVAALAEGLKSPEMSRLYSSVRDYIHFDSEGKRAMQGRFEAALSLRQSLLLKDAEQKLSEKNLVEAALGFVAAEQLINVIFAIFRRNAESATAEHEDFMIQSSGRQNWKEDGLGILRAHAMGVAKKTGNYDYLSREVLPACIELTGVMEIPDARERKAKMKELRLQLHLVDAAEADIVPLSHRSIAASEAKRLKRSIDAVSLLNEAKRIFDETKTNRNEVHPNIYAAEVALGWRGVVAKKWISWRTAFNSRTSLDKEAVQRALLGNVKFKKST